MDFSTKTRLKLRVAVCPFVASNSFENNLQHHRVVGVKRDADTLIAVPVILRQFLLLLPLDCTFSDLKSLTKDQYAKLYKSQPNYLPLKSVVLFKDSNECDLDWDYLVGDICSSNELVYAVVEVEEPIKKVKLSNEYIIKVQEPHKSSVNPQSSGSNITSPTQNQNQKTPQNQDKKVPEFKPTAIKPPTQKVADPKMFQNKQADKKPNIPLSEVTKKEIVPTVPNTPIVTTKSSIVIDAKPVKPVILESKTVVLEPKPVNSESKSVIIAEVEPLESKPMGPEVNQINPDTRPVVHVASEPVVNPVAVCPEIPISAIKKTPQSIRNPTSKKPIESLGDKMIVSEYPASEGHIFLAPDNAITPGQTPIPISTAPASIFIPRKSISVNDFDSSSEEEEDKNAPILSNIFGGKVIASEPRRSESFVLFDAGSSSSDLEEDTKIDKEITPEASLIKSSSIISLQAAPSSEIDDNTNVSSSSNEEDMGCNDTLSSSALPQSVTLRRLSSISPIMEPSEIPSLSELKESLLRAPTPIQIQNLPEASYPSPKKNHNHNSNRNRQQNHANGTNKRGRPSKKQFTTGRPKNNNN